MASLSSFLSPQIVGALACQKDSYLKTLETVVVSCSSKVKPPTDSAPSSKTSKVNPPSTPEKLWLIEFSDSVLFPEGGGQPSDHGNIIPLTDPPSDPIAVAFIQRDGLRCICHSPNPLPVGTIVRQELDFQRRWDHMQQHTGQHLLSAIMENHFNTETVGWGMGADGDMNYIEVPGKPSEDEMQRIQDKCNEAIREDIKITTETPDDAKVDSLPGDYDKEKGVVRVVSIGDLDSNSCCGTHLSRTSQISLILLHYTQSIRGTNSRIYFSAGDRAINISTASINSLRSIARALSSGSAPMDVLEAVKKLSDSAVDSKKKEKRLLMDIAKYEGDRVKATLLAGRNAWVYRADEGLDFINMVVGEIKDIATDQGLVVLAAGEAKKGGPIVIYGKKEFVTSFAEKVKESISGVKGGGKGERWQGKVVEWKKDDVLKLQKLTES